MKIILDDELSYAMSQIIIINLDIVIKKIKLKSLDKDDYEMIIDHLQFYKDLLKDAEINSNEKE